MINFFRTLIYTMLSSSSALRGLRLRFRYPNFRFSRGSEVDIRGSVEIDSSATLGRDLVLHVEEKGQLQIGASCYVGRFVELSTDSRIKIGEGTSLQDRCVLIGEIEIGKYCIFAYNIYISSGQHYFRTNPPQYIAEQDCLARGMPDFQTMHHKKVVIGEDCWLGINVVIMPGVELGRGCIVGANSVVTKSVAPYSIVAGSPSKQIGERLRFIPPRSIAAKNSEHIPYFYKGILTKTISQPRETEKVYYLADSQFTLCMTQEAKDSKIAVVARSATGQARTLIFSGQREKITSDFEIFEFKLSDQNSGCAFFHFHVEDCTVDRALEIECAFLV